MPDPAPMDLENMRSLGIRTIDLICGCGRHKEVDVDAYPGTEVGASDAGQFHGGEGEQHLRNRLLLNAGRSAMNFHYSKETQCSLGFFMHRGERWNGGSVKAPKRCARNRPTPPAADAIIAEQTAITTRRRAKIASGKASGEPSAHAASLCVTGAALPATMRSMLTSGFSTDARRRR